MDVRKEDILGELAGRLFASPRVNANNVHVIAKVNLLSVYMG